MSVIMEQRKRFVDPKEEVKKLQDLVKKLEIQNQQLRQNRQNRNTIVPKDSNINMASFMSNRRSFHESNYYKSKNRPTSPIKSEKRKSSTLEEVNLINIDDLELSEDESWLYSSPKSLPPEEETLSPYVWLRRDVEDPSNKELQLAKKALLNKLDELASLSVPPAQEQVKNHPVSRIQKPREIPIRKQGFGQSRVFDSRTFTRSRKKRNTVELPVIDPLDITDAADKDTSTEKSFNSNLENSLSISSIHTFTDVTEVQEIARLQEESLKQDIPIVKRHSGSSLSGRKFSASSRSSVSDVDSPELSFNVHSEDRQTPARSSRIYTDHSSASDQSSPPDSPYSSSMSLNTGSNTDSHHIIPSQTVVYNGGIKCVKSQQLSNPRLLHFGIPKSSSSHPRTDSRITPPSQKLHKETSFPASPTASRMRQLIPASNIYSSSVHDLDSHQYSTTQTHSVFPTEHVSSTQSSQSGLRKPSSYRQSKIPSKPRSGIPIKSRHVISRQVTDDDNWSEGCF